MGATGTAGLAATLGAAEAGWLEVSAAGEALAAADALAAGATEGLASAAGAALVTAATLACGDGLASAVRLPFVNVWTFGACCTAAGGALVVFEPHAARTSVARLASASSFVLTTI
ncbi:MAG: hypothetical protein JO247_20450 [Chloroflexi bacterium]|nr:hypothetical protein [Chloroflexota bacterium]